MYSEDILGLSESGDLMDSDLGCLPRDALIDSGMHFDPVEGTSSFSSSAMDNLDILD